MLMRYLKPMVLNTLLEGAPDAVGGIGYRLYTTLIDIVVVTDAPHAFLLARNAREAQAKVKTSSMLYEAFGP